MTRRTYGQFCGLVRALEIVGERWALVIVRDLLVGPRRYTDLKRGLPRIPTNILANRLRDLEEAGVVRRRLEERPGGAVVYELTERGQGLERSVMELGKWGAQLLTEPGPGEIITEDSMVMALRTIFRPQAARGVTASYELRLGAVTLHAQIQKGRLEVAGGPLPGADLVITAGPQLRELLAGEITPAQALRRGVVRIEGPRRLLSTFAEVFRI
ncbi:MAG TPA: winged helix-turn-helix transcriptional regulator [Gemmatimonadales bacterium]|nr:winged helix-turn-helix transcriptional regulator [Gemmatimonadales bacterium]